ncbi:TolC family protein, partial [Mariniphaga sediminis]|uniref:TolC family protein n=1 Tax=Mariniphaga sediminis TaxID=1628158 RepID=UPI00356779FC
QSNLSQVEVELYKLNEQVSQAFFTALAMDKQKEVLAAQKKVLLEKLKAVQSGVENQMMEKTAALALEAEILNLEQNELQLEAGKRTAIQMLSILTGITIDKNAELKYTTTPINVQSQLSRPELELFEAQQTTLEKQSDLLTKSRNPKIFGFGQAGYGRPGLNMLNENFDTYYVIGLGVSWNAFDWKKTSRQKQVLRLQSEMILKQKETFNQNISLLLAQQNEQIGKLEELLKTDSKMVTLRTEIAQSSASKLENETITTTDYIQDVQAETISKLNAELHRIQLNEAKEKYNLIKGKGVQ